MAVHRRLGTSWGGFTLIELMVVVAIIGILLGILIPSIRKMQEQGRSIQCQANLKSIVTSLLGYAQENRGSFPYGFHWTRTNGQGGSRLEDWQEAPGNNREFVTWASTVTKYTRPGYMPGMENEPANYSSMLQCPQAMTVRPHYVSYAMNMIVAVDPLIELSVSKPPRAQTRPARLSDMRNETALVWDTAVFVDSDYDIDFVVGLDIDGERFMKGAAIPQFRYYSKKDPFAGRLGNFGQNYPIHLESGKATYRNIDPPSHRMNSKESVAPYRGNLRFRHHNETVCNAAFADGSVGTFVAVPRSDKTIQSHNALRRNFMILWPGGVPADPAYPH